MVVSLNINDKIANELVRLFRSNDLNLIVNLALENYVNKNDKKITELFNNVEYYEDYDYKALRQRIESAD